MSPLKFIKVEKSPHKEIHFEVDCGIPFEMNSLQWRFERDFTKKILDSKVHAYKLSHLPLLRVKASRSEVMSPLSDSVSLLFKRRRNLILHFYLIKKSITLNCPVVFTCVRNDLTRRKPGSYNTAYSEPIGNNERVAVHPKYQPSAI